MSGQCGAGDDGRLNRRQMTGRTGSSPPEQGRVGQGHLLGHVRTTGSTEGQLMKQPPA